MYDADLQSYFDTIPHDKLLACVRMRVVDRSVLSLIRMWLKAVVIEPEGDPGRPAEGEPPESRYATRRGERGPVPSFRECQRAACRESGVC